MRLSATLFRGCFSRLGSRSVMSALSLLFLESLLRLCRIDSFEIQVESGQLRHHRICRIYSCPRHHPLSPSTPVLSSVFSPLCHPPCCSARLRFVWGLLCGMWGRQADSPESPRWISKHKTFDFGCQRMRSDTWLLNCPPRGLSERQSVQTQWSMGKSGGGGG